jgi:hypothetical protein
VKERHQNPTIGDTVRLRLFVYNSNNLADLVSVDSINLYVCDPTAATMENPEGKTLVAELDPANVVHESTGTYYIDVLLENPQFTLGKYTDEWTITVDSNIPAQVVQNEFRVYPQLWYTTPVPVVYDFSFDFQPNKIRKGSKQYLRIRVTPNVPRATDLARYYENLAIVGDVKVSIEQKCGPCVPAERDLRLIVDEESVCYKEKCYGYFLLDTEDMDCGVYGIWFTLCIGGNRYLSDVMNLQIFE